jgi:RimJ/RimL family protein N-acetyltransferase
MKYLNDGKPKTRDESWLEMAIYAGHWSLLGYGLWAVEEKSTGNFIGRIGLLNPEGWPGIEVAWTLTRSRWRQGFATEGAAAAIRYAFSTLELDHLVSLIDPGNVASIRVAERLGEQLEKEIEFRGKSICVYGIHRGGS